MGYIHPQSCNMEPQNGWVSKFGFSKLPVLLKISGEPAVKSSRGVFKGFFSPRRSDRRSPFDLSRLGSGTKESTSWMRCGGGKKRGFFTGNPRIAGWVWLGNLIGNLWEFLEENTEIIENPIGCNLMKLEVGRIKTSDAFGILEEGCVSFLVLDWPIFWKTIWGISLRECSTLNQIYLHPEMKFRNITQTKTSRVYYLSCVIQFSHIEEINKMMQHANLR